MPFRKSKATKAREAVTDQVSDRTDDLMAALEAAREALGRAADAAGRKGAELGKEATKAADKADGGWDRAPEPGAGTEPAASAEVTQLHGDGAGGDPARTPSS